jgi:hypothetical protein
MMALCAAVKLSSALPSRWFRRAVGDWPDEAGVPPCKGADCTRRELGSVLMHGQ